MNDNIIKQGFCGYMDGLANLKVSYRSSPNIAWVKYWGKYDEDYIIPINDSLGLTLNPQDIHTRTDILFSTQVQADALYLNGELHPISKRVRKMFSKIKQVVYERKFKDSVAMEKWALFHFQVKSVNSFPTASGMASSASGLACLAAALNGLFGNVLSSEQLSQLARLGSGSASRSICGGLVRWTGVSEQIFSSSIEKTPGLLEELSKKCISQTVVADHKLKNIKVLILLANDKQKQVSSTSGMQNSVETSDLITQRNLIAEKRINKILSCLSQMESTQDETKKENLFNEIAENIMRDSNQFHAICLDTYPPIFYLNQFSKQVIAIVDNLLNQDKELRYKVAYTFDAGPHAFLFMHQSVLKPVLHYFVNLFKIEENRLNEKARQNLAKSGQQIKFGEYKGEIICPHEMWVTDVGCGSTAL